MEYRSRPILTLASAIASSHPVLLALSLSRFFLDIFIDIVYTPDMDTVDYMAVVNDALTKLEALQRQRDAIDADTLKLEQLITATANLLPDEVKDLAMRRMET